jgi:hypothetical protein
MFVRKPKDLRKSSRTKLKGAAWIRLAGGFAARQCEVLDISNTGARIAVPSQQSVPNLLSLALQRGGQGRLARVKWRRGAEIGLEFSEAAAGRA